MNIFTDAAAAITDQPVGGEVISTTEMSKKFECQNRILANYSRSDQANMNRKVVLGGDNTDLATMDTFIDAMLLEFQTNGADANYENINP